MIPLRKPDILLSSIINQTGWKRTSGVDRRNHFFFAPRSRIGKWRKLKDRSSTTCVGYRTGFVCIVNTYRVHTLGQESSRVYLWLTATSTVAFSCYRLETIWCLGGFLIPFYACRTNRFVGLQDLLMLKREKNSDETSKLSNWNSSLIEMSLGNKNVRSIDLHLTIIRYYNPEMIALKCARTFYFSALTGLYWKGKKTRCQKLMRHYLPTSLAVAHLNGLSFQRGWIVAWGHEFAAGKVGMF